MSLIDIFHHLIANQEHVEHVQDLLDALLAHPATHTKTLDWARATMVKTYISEVASLSKQEHGLHYLVGVIMEEKLQGFDINAISQTMSAGAPCLWALIGGLLVANGDLKSRRDKWRMQGAKKRGRTGTDVDSQLTDDRSWEFLDQSVPIIDNNEDIPENIVELEEQCEEGLATIVSHIQ